ncbi:hypothetical protein [Burkholderia diffusa]|uniref:glycine-rich domain-containing protein n=1 Tax=Burkholderia diffusa TaxID=488732 RepID=UPI000B0E913F|nr:hypothetical protein [Burkholderia diffusa]
MANNNFKAFAAAANANVMTQADYEALSALLTGFQSGTAQSQQLNKVWRQSSIMAAVLAQFIVDMTGQDAIDDGTTATLLANLKKSMPGRLRNTQVFQIAGTFVYTPTAGTNKVRVRVIGAGGGGGGSSAATATTTSTAGGAGGYAEGLFTAGFAGVSVVVGSGGAGGVAGNNIGSNGGASSFGSLLSATGGSGGGAIAATASPYLVTGSGSGIVAGGTINQKGCVGGHGLSMTTSYGVSGAGGGTGLPYANSARGADSQSPGGGGGGACSGVNSPAFSGGRGADGIVIVEEFA